MNGRAADVEFETRRAKQAALLDRIDEIAEVLAETRDFYAAANEAERVAVARRVVPEFDEYFQPGNPLASQARTIVVEAASRAREVRRRIVEEAKGNVDRYADLVRQDPDYTTATTKDDRQRIAKRVITDELGFPDTDFARVVAQAARSSRAPLF